MFASTIASVPSVASATKRASFKTSSVRASIRARQGTTSATRSTHAANVAVRGTSTRAHALAKQPPSPEFGGDAVWDPLGLRNDETGDTAGEGWFRADAFGFGNASRRPTALAMSTGRGGGSGDGGNMGDFFSGKLPGKIATVFALLVLSRVGTYIPISGVDRAAFAESLQGSGGMMAYADTLTGGSISKLGIFSLGIVPYINSSIIFQLLGSVFPELKKLQKEEGEAGRRKFQQYQR
jgi:hypothetical protein